MIWGDKKTERCLGTLEEGGEDPHQGSRAPRMSVLSALHRFSFHNSIIRQHEGQA